MIDLEQIKFLLHRHGILSGSDPHDLISEVESLLEDKNNLLTGVKAAYRIVDELRDSVEEMKARTIEQNIEYMKALGFALERANIAEDQVGTMRGYFTVIRRKVRDHPPSTLIQLTVDNLATEALCMPATPAKVEANDGSQG